MAPMDPAKEDASGRLLGDRRSLETGWQKNDRPQHMGSLTNRHEPWHTMASVVQFQNSLHIWTFFNTSRLTVFM